MKHWILLLGLLVCLGCSDSGSTAKKPEKFTAPPTKNPTGDGSEKDAGDRPPPLGAPPPPPSKK